MNKANKFAQEAQAAENRAEALKQQAIEECQRANELWNCYENASNSAQELMEEAQCCLQQAAQCYQNYFNDDFGCNLEDYGYTDEYSNCEYNNNNNNNNNNGYGCNCGCNCGCNNN